MDISTGDAVQSIDGYNQTSGKIHHKLQACSLEALYEVKVGKIGRSFAKNDTPQAVDISTDWRRCTKYNWEQSSIPAGSIHHKLWTGGDVQSIVGNNQAFLFSNGTSQAFDISTGGFVQSIGGYNQTI